MTSQTRNSARTRPHTRFLNWLTTLTGMAALITMPYLALTGHPAAATAAAAIGAGASAVGGIQVAVNTR